MASGIILTSWHLCRAVGCSSGVAATALLADEAPPRLGGGQSSGIGHQRNALHRMAGSHGSRQAPTVPVAVFPGDNNWLAINPSP